MLHPKIQHLQEELQKLSLTNVLNIESLKHLQQLGATQTESAITLHMGFDIPLEDAEKIVRESKLWTPEEINDIAYQTFTYLYYTG